jgi:hypothetical protein
LITFDDKGERNAEFGLLTVKGETGGETLLGEKVGGRK